MIDRDTLQHDYFECLCNSEEHVLRVTYFPDPVDDFDELYFSVHLNPVWPWYKRMWQAIRYIFGYHCKYGHFEEMSIKHSSAIRLRDLLTKFIEENEARQK